MMIRFCKVLIGALLLGIISGCTTYLVDGEQRNLSVRYGRGDVPVETGALFAIAGDYRHAFSGARGALIAAGFDIVSFDQQTGRIEISSNSVATVHCGTVATGPLSDPNIFPANTPVAILEVPAEGGGSTFIRRNVAVRTTATVQIAVDPAQGNAVFARVSENHTVHLSLRNVTGGEAIYSQIIEFPGNQTRNFRRGVTCGSARYIRDILSAI